MRRSSYTVFIITSILCGSIQSIFGCSWCNGYVRHSWHSEKKKDENEPRINRIHITAEMGVYSSNIDEAISQILSKDFYKGSVTFVPGLISLIDGVPDANKDKAVLNLSVDFSLSKRLKLGVGVNGIPQVQVTGYVDLDSLDTYENYYTNKVEEIISGTTAKLQMLYALKKYKGRGFGFEINAGIGLSYNFVNLKQNYLISVFDSTSQQWIQGYEVFDSKYSSLGAFGLLRLDVYFTNSFSWVTDITALYDTGILIDETSYTFEQVQQSVSSHNLRLNAFMVSTGIAFHF